MALSFYLNGVLSDPPENWQECQIELSFDNNSPSASVNVNSFDFVGDNATFINTWIAQGLTGGNGITEGIPFEIKACNNITIFSGVLDLTAEGNYFDCDRCTVFLKQTDKIDWLSDVADGFTFAYLASDQVTGAAHIGLTDYVAIPYVINTIPNYTQAMLMGASVMIIQTQIIFSILELTDLSHKLSASLATATATAGLTSAQMFAYVLELILLLAYLASLIAAFIVMILDMKKYLYQDLKYKYGMRVQDLFTKACSHLGLTFQSTILKQGVFADLVIIPQKYTIKDQQGLFSYRNNPDDNANAKSYGYFDGTFGDLIRQMNDVFNAKVTIVNNTLHFEVFDNFQNISTYTLPDIVQEPYQTNASELASNYFVTFATDERELNTFDDFGSTNAQCQFSQVVTGTQKNVMLKSLVNKQLAFAKAVRKDDYTFIETLVKDFCDLFYLLYSTIYTPIDALLNIVNQIGTFLGLNNLTISNPLPPLTTFAFDPRIGTMLLETDFVGVPKLLIATNNKNDTIISENGTAIELQYVWQYNYLYVNAEYLLRNYHSHSFWIDTTLNIHNQFYKYKDKEIPFCCEDYNAVNLCNWIYTYDNKVAKIIRLMWTPEKEEAKVDYDVKEKYTNNIKQKYIVDGVEI